MGRETPRQLRLEGPAAGGSALGQARCRWRRGWRRPCCLPAASAPLLPAPSSLRLPSPLPPAPARPPSPTEPLLSLLLQVMAAASLLLSLLAVLSVFQLPLTVGNELDEATQDRKRWRADLLDKQMRRLQQDLEETHLEPWSQKESDVSWGALAGVLVLLLGLGWWLMKRSHWPASSSKESGSGKKAEEREQESKPSLALHARLISVERLLELSESFMKVEVLVDDLLRICHKRSRDTGMPRVKAVVGVESALGGWGPQEDDATYRLLVPLKPPHGHAFHLELGTMEGMPAKHSCIRVEPECSCKRERLEKDTLCFLHCHQEQLRKNRGPSLLNTFCTGPYLDVEKTARWFQDMVKDAWVALPQSRHCHLKVLPSKRSCKLRLTDASGSTVFIHMMLGVQQGDSYAVLSIH
ncbi:LOW QUALITY PROTEIN: uncharacterized protein LOC141735753 [Larus michahellis]|uniref:LOW QUALITY PROTEIN: uncharacterized protein LOC141735743 n=1 Tax=Larus michahellis TaxID=119627 RepID=UPI003D9B7E8B